MPPGKLKLGLCIVLGSSWLWANSPPTFTAIVQDTVAYEDRYWSTWLEASDPDDDPLTFRLLPGAPAGIQINASSGFLNWTPTNLEVGVYNLIAEVSDGSLTDFLPFKLYVLNMNDTPYWTVTPPAEASVFEDSLYTFTLHAGDDDAIHGDVIHYILKLAPDGATIDAVTGTVRWRPDNRHVGTHTFSVWAQDDSAATIQATWNVTVRNSPVAFLNSPPVTVLEDQTYTFDLESSDEGQGNTAYSFINGSQPEWLTINAKTGLLAGTPVNNQVGSHPVKIQVDDGNGSQALLELTIDVVNSRPTITTTTLPVALEDAPYSADINADDEGLGNTSYRFITDAFPLPAWLIIEPNTGVITGTPDNSHVGFYPFEVEFDDGNGGKDTAQLFIEVQNVPPVLQYPNLVTDVIEDNLYSYDFNSTDDGKGTVLYNSIVLPSWLTLNQQTGLLSGTPNNEHVGANPVILYVSDGNLNGTDTLEFVINVQNRTPVLLSTPVTSVAEDAPYTYDINTDDENHGATYSLMTFPPSSNLTIDPNTGLLTGVFPNNFVGSQYIAVLIDDGHGGQVNHQFTVEVTNIPPRFTAVADQTVIEDQLYTLDIETDDEGVPAVTYALRNPPSGMNIDPISGLIQWTPDNSQVGNYAIRVLATDNHGGTDSLTFNLQVQNVAPTITSTPFTRAREDSLYYYDVASIDEGVGATTYTLTTPVSWLTIDPQSGIIQGTPTDSDVGTHHINVRVDDGNGGIVNQSWTITVYNLTPTITTDALPAATEDVPWEATMGVQPPAMGNYVWSLQGAAPAWLNIDPISGTLSGIPTNSAVGRHTITVRVTDLNGAYTDKALNIDVTNVAPTFLTTDKIYATEDQALTFDLQTDDEGDEGNGISGYTLITYPSSWLSCDPNTGVLTGTPRDTDVGTHTLVVRYQDGNGGFADLTTELVVANTPPQITYLNPPTAIAEDQLYSYQFTSDDDPWNHVTYSALNALPAGLTLTSSGLLSGRPLNAAVGVNTIDIIATDANGGRDTLSFTLQVSNAAPTFSGLTITPSPYTQNQDSIFVREDLPYQFDFAADDEGDGVNAIYSVQSKPAWLTFNNPAAGILSGTPTNAHIGVSTLTITFSDGNGGSFTKTYYLKVLNVAPQFTNALTTTIAYEDQAYQLDLNSTDDGQGTVTYSILSGNPGWLQIDASTGLVSSITGRPDNADVTSGVPVNFLVDDGHGGRDTLTIVFIVHNMNDAPVWLSAPSGVINIAEDATYTTTLVATDVDAGDQLTYSLIQSPANLTLHPTTGVLSWTPSNAQVGLHTVTAQVVDDSGAVITRTWNLNVTNVGSPIAALTTNDFSPSIAVSVVADTFYIYEDTVYTINLSTADEGVGDNYYYDLTGLANPTWISLIDQQAGLLRLTPLNQHVGLDSIQVHFYDQPGSATSAKFYLRVLNTPPILISAGPFTATEGVAFSYDLDNTDETSGLCQYTFAANQPAWLTIDAQSGVISGTPTNNDVGSHNFTIAVTDGHGGSAQQTYTINVTNVNDAPILAAVHDTTIQEDNLWTYTLQATDVDAGDQLTFSLITAPPGMQIDPATGTLTWTPVNADVGVHPVLVKVQDMAGAFATQSFQITVQNVLPTFAPITLTHLTEDLSFSYDVDCSDEGSGNTVYALLAPPAWLSINPQTGLISGTPLNSEVGNHSVTIQVNDGTGTVFMTWNFTVVNTPPTITSEPDTIVYEDDLYVYDANSSDDNQGTIRYTAPVCPGWLSIDTLTGNLTGTPRNANVGDTLVVIQVTDGNGGSATQSFRLHVINTNDPPEFTSLPVTAAIEDSLYCYTLTASDPDNDFLTYSLIQAPSGMTIDANTGSIQWIPGNNYSNKNVSVQARVSDPAGAFAIQDWMIAVTNTAPQFTTKPAKLYATEDALFTYDFNTDDEGWGTGSYQLLQAAGWLTLTDAITGVISGTPRDSNVTTSTPLKICYSDGNGGYDTLLTTLAVNNSAPLFYTAGDTTATEGISFSRNLQCDDEITGSVTYLALSMLPPWLTLNPATGLLTGTPLNSDVGALALSFRVFDTHGGSSDLNFTIEVRNAPPQLIANPPLTATEDSLYTFACQLADASGEHTFSLSLNPGWLVIDSATGKVTGIPLNNHVGDNPFRVTVRDAFGAADSLTFMVSVQNSPPHISTTPIATAQEDLPYILDIDCSDEGQGTLAYYALTKPEWLTLAPATGKLTGTPRNRDVTAAAPVKIVVDDGHAGYDTLEFNLQVLNTAPQFTRYFTDTLLTEDDSFSFDLQSDDEGDGPTKYALIGDGLPWLTLDTLTGRLSGTPLNQHVKEATPLQVQVDDGNGGKANLIFFIAVQNNPPQFVQAPPDTFAMENVPWSYDFTTTDESQGQAAYSLVPPFPAWIHIDTLSGRLQCLANNSQVGTYPLQVRFEDGNGASITHTFQLTIQNTNDRPYFLTTQTSDTTAEDELWSFTVSAGDSDLIHLDTLKYLLAGQPSDMQIDSLSGQISWTPDNQVVGVHQFYLIVTDKFGARDSLSFTLTVTNVNDAPVFTAQNDTTAYEDQLFELVLKATDVDVGDTLVYTLLQAPAGATLQQDTIHWLPHNAQVASWQFIVGVTDRAGLTARDTFSVTVYNTNDPPRLNKSVTLATLYEDSLWSYQFAATDDDSAYGDKLTFSLQNAPLGLTIVDSTGLVTWIPTNAQVGSDSFIVVVTDKALASDQLLFHLQIINTNDPPQIIALNDTSIYEDSLFLYTIKYLEVDPNDTVIFSLVAAPPAMQLDSLSGLLSWRPTNDDRDRDFTVVVCVTDLAGASALDTFSVHVINTNDAPILAALPAVELFEDTPLTLPYSHWYGYVLDIDNADSLLIWDYKNFRFLTCELISDSVRFTPAADFFGNDTGLVIVSDGELTDTSELVITVLPVNDPPIIASNFPTKISFAEDSSTTLALNKYVTDVDNDTTELHWYVEPYLGQQKLSTLPVNKTSLSVARRQTEISSIAQRALKHAAPRWQSTLVIRSSDGDSIMISIDPQTHIATFTARPNFFIDSVNFHFFVTDSSLIPPLGRDSAVVCLAIQPVNDPPVLSDIPPITVAEDSVLQVNVVDWYRFVTDVDNPDSTLSWTVENGHHLQVQQSDKIFTITPEINWFGEDTLRVIVSDGSLNDTTTWVINYYSVNDPPTFAAIPDTSFLEDDTLFIDLNPFIDDAETPKDSLKIVFTALSGTKLANPDVAPATKRGTKLNSRLTTAAAAAAQDSLIIELDPTTHIAKIYGTPNYFTAPLPYRLTVYDDSLASASIIWHLAIQAVNDPPVLSTLPPLSCAEDSSCTINLTDWYNYVADVETPDHLLHWQFSSDTTLLLTYDTTHQSLQIRPYPDWFGVTQLTVIVTDPDGGADTTLVAVTVYPRNDPPVIDTLLLTQQLFQTDTLRLTLSNFVHDVDHPIDSLRWAITSPKHVHLTHNTLNQTLKIWCGYDWFGHDTLQITVTDPAGAADTQRMIIMVADTSRPRFRFAVYQNQLTSKFITIAAYPDERLVGLPIITINTDTCQVTAIPDSVPYFQTNFTIDSSMILKVAVTGIDLAGNRGGKEYQFGVAKISVAQGGMLSDPDTLMTFIFGAGAVNYDLCVLYLPTEPTDSLFKLAKSSQNGPVSPVVEFLAPIGQLIKPARVVFNLARLNINQQDAQYLGLYHWENNRWNYLKTYTGLETATYWAYASKPGRYQIQLSTANPVTVLSSAFSLAPNYPNPFNSQTIIRYVIGVGEFHSFTEAVQTLQPVKTSIRIYNLLGQEVKTLVNEPQLPGTYTIIWDGRNNAGQPVASGPYFCLAVLGDQVLHRKMLLIK